jgi:RNA polymerase sigma-70 factor (ECF subfamily)
MDTPESVKVDTEDDCSLASSIVEGLRRQDGMAWARLERLFRPVVGDWCRQKGVAQSDAEDLAQQVFLAVHKGIAQFRRERPGDSFKGWLWTITSHKIADFFRARGDQGIGGSENQILLQEVPANSLGSCDSAESDVGRDRTAHILLRGVMTELEQEFEATSWRCFRGMVIDGHSAQELARELGMTPKAVRQAKFRVLNRLRREMADLA